VTCTTLHRIVIIVFALLSTSPAARADTVRDAERDAHRRMEDTLLTVRVKGALITDEVTREHRIHIETFQGIIQLSGSVGSEEEKTRAGEVAATVEGVVEVRNAIEVRQALASRDDGPVTRVARQAATVEQASNGLQVEQR
jgi:osmotically-inducible protein OsmY